QGMKGVRMEVALSSAAEYLALPRQWGLTRPAGFVGGAHAGYGVYACRDGRVAVAALEPHFAAALCGAAGLAASDLASLQSAATRAAIARFLKKQTRTQLDALAAQHDIPLHTMA
ncbi:MAG: CoA transferase, partial [Polaromonas sp.]|nr:CoA transferase [Polaromonas sp.]